MTVIRSTSPARVGKTYRLDAGGALHKHAVANVVEGDARCIEVPTAEALAGLLARVTARDDLVLCPGAFAGAGSGWFRLVPEAVLARRMGSAIGVVPGGVHDVGGERIAARVKRGIAPSGWLLLDCDSPVGMPPAWAAMTIAERLRFLDPIIPGIDDCERVEVRSSSARVHPAGGHPGLRSHAWIRVSDPSRIAILKAATAVAMVAVGLAFPSPRFSRITPGAVVGHQHRTVVDLAVWDAGRLVFNAQPDVSAAPGFVVADAGVRIRNPGAGVLDLSAVALPDAEALRAYRETTGSDLAVRMEGERLVIRSAGELRWTTEIEVRGRVRTLREWTAGMRPGDRLRCETPFRASVSEAGVVRMTRSGRPVLHDVGSGVTHVLADEPGERDARRAFCRIVLALLRDGIDPEAVRTLAIHKRPDCLTEADAARAVLWCVSTLAESAE